VRIDFALAKNFAKETKPREVLSYSSPW